MKRRILLFKVIHAAEKRQGYKQVFTRRTDQIVHTARTDHFMDRTDRSMLNEAMHIFLFKKTKRKKYILPVNHATTQELTKKKLFDNRQHTGDQTNNFDDTLTKTYPNQIPNYTPTKNVRHDRENAMLLQIEI